MHNAFRAILLDTKILVFDGMLYIRFIELQSHL